MEDTTAQLIDANSYFQVGQNMGVTIYGTHAAPTSNLNVQTSATTNTMTVTGPFGITKRGTLMQKLHVLSPGSYTPATGQATIATSRLIKLQARLLPHTNHPTPQDYIPQAGTAVIYPDQTTGGTIGPRALIRVKNFSYFEVNPSASS